MTRTTWRRLAGTFACAGALVGQVSDGKADPTTPEESGAGLYGEGSDGNAKVQSATGAMTYSYPFAVPPARGGIGPSLGLTYSSSSRDREAGYGWGIELPTIELRPITGFPTFAVLPGQPSNIPFPSLPTQRYLLSGAPLVLICTVGSDCPAEPNVAGHPSWAAGWRYFRQQVEGSYSRIYQSADYRTFRIQVKGGRILELGVPAHTDGWDDYAIPAGIETDRSVDTNPQDRTGIIRYRLVVERDGLHPKNAAVYKWSTLGARGLLYLTSVYDTPSVAGSSSDLGSFANHVQLDWEPVNLSETSYAFVDKATADYRLRRVGVAAKPSSGTGEREVVRTYELGYLARRWASYNPATDAPLWNHNFLKQVQMAGKCGLVEFGGEIPETQGCPTLPPTSFEYSTGAITGFAAVTPSILGAAPGTPAGGDVFDRPKDVTTMDIDRDGLPDVIQGWSTKCPPADPPYKATVRDGNTDHSEIRCQPDTLPFEPVLHAARPMRAYLNGGVAGNRQQLSFRCVDAGSGAPGTLPNIEHDAGASLRSPGLVGR